MNRVTDCSEALLLFLEFFLLGQLLLESELHGRHFSLLPLRCEALLEAEDWAPRMSAKEATTVMNIDLFSEKIEIYRNLLRKN